MIATITKIMALVSAIMDTWDALGPEGQQGVEDYVGEDIPNFVKGILTGDKVRLDKLRDLLETDEMRERINEMLEARGKPPL